MIHCNTKSTLHKLVNWLELWYYVYSWSLNNEILNCVGPFVCGYFLIVHVMVLDFPGGSDSKASAYSVGDLGSIPGLGRPTPVLLPGKSHGWRSLVVYSPWDRKGSDTTEWLQFNSNSNYGSIQSLVGWIHGSIENKWLTICYTKLIRALFKGQLY